MNGGASRVPFFLTVFAVLVLVGVVAVASSGSTPTGTDDTRPPSEVIFDTIMSLGMVLLIPGLAILVYGLTQRKAIAKEMASGRYRRTGVLTFVGLMALLGVMSYFRLRGWESPLADGPGDAPLPGGAPGVTEPVGEIDARPRTPQFEWIPVLVIVSLAAVGIAAYVLAGRRQRPPLAFDDAVAAEEVASLLDDSLDDLRAEPDPRRAVIAAYARLERALGASGLPRRQEETADEYVTRILDSLEVERDAVRTLSDLFRRAKFSHHDVSEAMKAEAIAALARIRDELRAAARRRAEEHSVALASGSEQAALP